MRFRSFDWDEWNVDHIARHGIEPHEAETACRSEGRVVRRSREGRYLVYGRTGAGRHVLVVLRPFGQGRARIITARDMTERERRFYQQQRS